MKTIDYDRLIALLKRKQKEVFARMGDVERNSREGKDHPHWHHNQGFAAALDTIEAHVRGIVEEAGDG